jgi:dethiobiotin synthetase
MTRKIFITGTDTGIGKTVISTLLADYLVDQGVHCGYLKLVSCGGPDCGDCHDVHSRAGVSVRNGYHFFWAASPHLAAEHDGQQIDIGRLSRIMAEMDSQYDVLLVEGAGGLHVPLTRSLLLGDYIAGSDMQALVVARSGLGTINHTLLTLEGLAVREIPILGVLVNDEQVYPDDDLLVTDNMRTIGGFADVPVLGRLRRFDSWQQARLLFAETGANIRKQLYL